MFPKLNYLLYNNLYHIMSIQKEKKRNVFETKCFLSHVFDNNLEQMKNYFDNPYNKIYLRGETFEISPIKEKKKLLKIHKNTVYKIKCLNNPISKGGLYSEELFEINSFHVIKKYKYHQIINEPINFNLELVFTLIDNTCEDNIFLYLELEYDKSKVISDKDKNLLKTFIYFYEIWDYPDFLIKMDSHSKKQNIENYIMESITVNCDIKNVINFIKSPVNIFKAGGTDKYHNIKIIEDFKNNYSIIIFNEKTKQTFTFVVVKVKKNNEGIDIQMNETIKNKIENSKIINMRIYYISDKITWFCFEEQILFYVNKKYIKLVRELIKFYLKKSKIYLENNQKSI